MNTPIFCLPPFSAVTSINNGTITFNDGFSYKFRDPQWLRLAQAVDPDLHKTGERVMEDIVTRDWALANGTNNKFNHYYTTAMATKKYRAWQADNSRLVQNLPRFAAQEYSDDLKAAMIEALIGAIVEDTGTDGFTVVRLVMQRFGVCWPWRTTASHQLDRHFQYLRSIRIII